MSPSWIGVVTGANKGIGLAIVRNLALAYSQSPFANEPGLIYLTARNKDRGSQALEDLLNDSKLQKAGVLTKYGGNIDIEYHQLDISDSQSIQGLADFLKKTHASGIDAVVNNAGIAMNGFDINVVESTLKSNYYGTLEASQALLPLIREGGRLVNVSSIVGKLGKYSNELRNAFHKADSVDEISSLMAKFTTDVREGKERERGWPSAGYAVSKAGVTGMTLALATQEKRSGKWRLVNACCPGYVVTDMTKGGGIKTPDQGAQTPVLLAIGDIKNQSGLFWEDEKPSQW